MCNMALSSGWRTFSLSPFMGKIEKQFRRREEDDLMDTLLSIVSSQRDFASV